LEELISSQRRFVADASHQLRSPLTALRLRLENTDLDDQDAVSTDIDAALDETARLSRLVDGLLALARAEGTRPAREPVDVDQVLTRRLDAWSAFAAERDVNLDIEFVGGATAVASLVPEYLEQILDNLIDNALDATPPGRAVTLRRVRTSGYVEIHVVDEGTGMTDEALQHAFDRFWRSGQDGSSTGLGLAIVDQLARASGGRATLQRSPTNGVDAAVAFPVTTGEPSKPRSAPAPSSRATLDTR
jgi:signal transduction histidine kinase